MSENKIRPVSYYKKKYPACRIPSLSEMKEWFEDGGSETPSGEVVECDGYDKFGNPSWMLILGFI